MTYLEFTSTLKDLGFDIPNTCDSQKQWNITSKQLKYVEGIKGTGVDILWYDPPDSFQTVRKSIYIDA